MDSAAEALIGVYKLCKRSSGGQNLLLIEFLPSQSNPIPVNSIILETSWKHSIVKAFEPGIILYGSMFLTLLTVLLR